MLVLMYCCCCFCLCIDLLQYFGFWYIEKFLSNLKCLSVHFVPPYSENKAKVQTRSPLSTNLLSIFPFF